MKIGKFIAGVGIGTVIGMLLEPKKGSELRQDLKDKSQELYDKAQNMTKEDVIDYSVGVKLSAKRGDYVKCGDCLATIYAANKDKILEAEGLIIKAFEISEDIVKTSPLIKRIISCKNI